MSSKCDRCNYDEADKGLKVPEMFPMYEKICGGCAEDLSEIEYRREPEINPDR